MKFNGNEWVSLQVEKNGKPFFRLCNITLYDLLNIGLKDLIMENLRDSNEIKKFTTQFVTFNNFKISKGSKVNIKFEVSLEEDHYNIYRGAKFSAYFQDLDIKDIYNSIVELFENYAYELDTDIDNIKIEMTELIVNETEENLYENKSVLH